MAERVVVVRLSAKVAEYTKGMDEAARKTREVGSQAEKLAQTREALQTVGRAGMVMGATLAAGIGVAISKYAEFDQAMSNVAATGEDARASLGELRKAAIDAGAETVFSAKESANAIEELAKAGLSAGDILAGGLKGSLSLAAAGGLGVAQAAGIAATTLQQFKLEGDKASHVADLLAAGAGKAMGDVSDLSQALSQGGLVANQFGISVEETVGTLSAFASAGMLGSDAGTSFRTMLLRLANPTGEAADKMAELGISAYDAQGNFVGMSGLAGQLQKGLKGLTQEQQNAALAIIFGQDAIRGANVLMKEGANGIQDWTNKVNDQGYAAKTAATRLDNLKGDIEQLGGALDSLFISSAEGANGPLRGLIQALTDVVNWFNGLPDWANQSILLIGAIAAGVAFFGGAALVAVPKVIALRLAVAELGGVAGIARGGLSRLTSFLGGPWGIAFVGAALAVEGLRLANDAGSASTEDLRNSLLTASDAATVFAKATQGHSVENFIRGDGLSDLKDLPKLMDDASVAWTDLNLTLGQTAALDRLGDVGKALAEIAATDLPRATEEFRMLAKGMDSKQAAELLKRLGPEFHDALVKVATDANLAADDTTLLSIAMGKTKATSGEAAAAYKEQASKVQDLRNELKSLLDTINESNVTNQDAISANAAYQASLAGIADQVKQQQDAYEQANGSLDGFTLSLDSNTASGSENEKMLSDVAAAAQNAADKQFAVDSSTMSAKDATDKYAATLAAQKQAFIDSAVAAGFNADEVKALADRVFQMPDEKRLKVIAETAAAQNSIDQFVQLNDGRRVKVFVDAEGGQSFRVGSTTVSANANGGIYSGGVKAFADSGFVPGIYPYVPGGIHKFAEQYAEAYISMDPARRARSEAVWVETGRRFGMLPPQSAQSTSGQSVTNVDVRNDIRMFDRDPFTVGKQIGRAIERSLHG